MPAPYRVYIGLAEQYGYARQVLRGIVAYARRDTRRWAFRRGALDANLRQSLAGWAPDGVIVQCSGASLEDLLLEIGLPVVNVSTKLSAYRVPTVAPDNMAAGALAAEHLTQCGLQHLAFWPDGQDGFLRERTEGFIAAAGRLGVTLHRPPRLTGSLARMAQRLTSWMRSLPKPVGVLVAEDSRAPHLCEACLAASLHVPDEVSVLGIGDEAVECELTPVPLSSVTLPGERVGYEAMALLDRLLAGMPAPAGMLRFPPLGVTMRSSTRVQSPGDPYVDEIIRHIHAHATEPLCIAELADRVPLSRRTLEQRFLQHRGHTMGDEIRLARVQRARALLVESDRPIAQIALACGFSGNSHLTRVFSALLGTTPRDLRRQARGA